MRPKLTDKEWEKIVQDAFSPGAPEPHFSPRYCARRRKMKEKLAMKKERAFSFQPGLMIATAAALAIAAVPVGILWNAHKHEPVQQPDIQPGAVLSETTSATDGGEEKILVAPNLTSFEHSQEQAEELLKRLGIPYEIQSEPNDTVSEGIVFRTIPNPGELLAENAVMQIFVSTGKADTAAQQAKFMLIPNGDEETRFGMTLPQDRTHFAFDENRMQQVLDTFDWNPVDYQFDGFEPGYFVIVYNSFDKLYMTTVPVDTEGHYLICRWQEGTERVFYYADEAFIREVLTVVQDTAKPFENTGEIVIVPDITNYHYEYAKKILEQEGFLTYIKYEASDEVESSNVIRTMPPMNSRCDPGTPVTLYVSKGASQESGETVTVPDITNYHYEYAKKILEQEGFRTQIMYESSDEVQASNVIRTEPPAGNSLLAGDVVVLYISKGAGQEFEMPDCKGLTQEQATALLEYYGMTIEVSTEPSDKKSGTVIGQSNPPGEKLPKGSTIQITVAE